MRHDPFDPRPGRWSADDDEEPYALTGGMPPPDADDEDGIDPADLPPEHGTSRWRWLVRGLAAATVLLVVAVAWLAITAPLSKSLKPPTPPSITLTAENGTPIARRGAIIGKPVDVAKLPEHIPQAFLAIEDRRFYSHWGIDPHGLARAMWHNVRAGHMREGGSTITQQLAKNAFLDADRTAGRKLREALISVWLEAWLSKDEILSRYLSNVYFGDNVYGLSAAARHYFNRTPERLTVGQAAMLAGLVKAPSRLAPTGNLKGARARAALVVGAMHEAGFLTAREAAGVTPASVASHSAKQLPNGTYFADWVLPDARDQAGELRTESTVETTLDIRLQRAAERAVARAGLSKAQVALVAMRPDGRVVAMVGGKSYAASPFNRATQARRQPGSAFKLFVYLAALRSGMTPDSTVEDEPLTIAGWHPENSDKRYRGTITLREAFARSSNVAAVRLTQRVGVRQVIRAARDLGISTPIANEASIALGTQTVSLLELTAAYAAIAAESYPVRPHGLDREREKGWLEALGDRSHGVGGSIERGMRDLLSASVHEGTGRSAALSIDSFGKTGTTQDNRDALFLGFARDLVVGVWVGNDDNTPNPGLSGGGIPARVWRDFMQSALGVGPLVREPVAAPDEDEGEDGNAILPDGIDAQLRGLGLDLQIGRDGSIEVNRERPRDEPPRPERDRPPPEEEEE